MSFGLILIYNDVRKLALGEIPGFCRTLLKFILCLFLLIYNCYLHVFFLNLLAVCLKLLDPGSSPPVLSPVLMCSAGQSMNRWSLEEMVKRDPENFLILLQQIIRKTREVGLHKAHRGGQCVFF